MSEVGIEPTYIGNNENLVFIVPKELFKLSLKPEDALDRETAKKFSKYMRMTFKGFQNSRKTKFGNENNTKTDVTPIFWNKFEKKASDLGVDLIGYTPVDERFVFHNLKIYIYQFDQVYNS